MIVLGAYLGHDSNFALLRDGKILAHVESERVSRRKHQRGMHRATLEGMLAAHGVTLDDVDLIAVGGSFVSPSSDPHPDLVGLESAVAESSRKIHDFPAAAQTGAVDGWVATQVTVRGRTVPVVVVNHHLAHASLALFTAPFHTGVAVSWDGGGDGSYLMSARAERGRLTECVYNPPARRLGLSIGAPWTTLPLLFPFPEAQVASTNDKYLLDLEGKVMGLAAYGRPREDLTALIRGYMENFVDGHAALIERARHDLPKMGLQPDQWSLRVPHRDMVTLAASLQVATESAMSSVLAAVVRPGEEVAVTGGCAYNCVANGELFKRYPRLYVPACPHDGGLGLGAALLAWYHLGGNEYLGTHDQTPYLGTGQWRADPRVAPQVADDLATGRIVAWFDGPAESGKRALGARSILLDPRRTDGKNYLNDRVKHREWFRPFAPSCVVDQGWERVVWWEGEDALGIGVFQSSCGVVSSLPPSPYMSFSATVREDWRERIPAVTHVDGTCRPQLVSKKNNPTYHEIIHHFMLRTGVPMVLNTSFNVQEPIVDTPEHARRTFANAPGIDVLYLHGERIAR